MPYAFEPGKMYRMPTHFGPRTGPRRGEDGRTFENKDTPKTTTVAVSFLSDQGQLADLLPECYEPWGDPVVTVYASYMTEIEWLAGRGYNVLGVLIPAAFNGEIDHVKGNLLTVLWENLTDPIITGREELGYAKIYCELPPPKVLRGNWSCEASWMGFSFLELEAIDMEMSPVDGAGASAKNAGADGVLHYKYMPRTGEWGTADVAYPTFTPSSGSHAVVRERWAGQGRVAFHRARWEDMPTQYSIVNCLSDLKNLDYVGASVTKSVGSKDLSDQRILR